MPVVPGNAPGDDIFEVAAFADAMPFPRVTDHAGFYSDVFEADVELLDLCGIHQLVVVSMDEHYGRMYFVDEPDGRPKP